MPRRRLDLVGERFGRLVVLKYIGNNKRGSSQWLCRCECGNDISVAVGNLRGNHTRSCGCLIREKNSEMCKNRTGKNHPMFGKKHTKESRQEQSKTHKGENNGNYKHGLKGTKAYVCQCSAKRRARKKSQIAVNYDQEKVNYLYSFCAKLNETGFFKYVLDHWQPISKGGEHGQDNMQILLKKLNEEKSDKWPLTEVEQIKFKGITLADIEKGNWIDVLAEGNYKKSNYDEQKNSL